MSCYHCSTKFNFFNKELGCNNCGLSFCNKCLKQKCKVPSKGSGEYNVCRVCFLKLSSGSADDQDTVYPPDRFLKRLENLENPAAPPITVYKQDPKMNSLKSGLSSADKELVDRLEKLKEKQVIPLSESEIRQRLAHLKGESLENSSTSMHTPYTRDNRTDQEKVDSLLEQFSSEQEIEKHDPQDKLVKRLLALKGEEIKSNTVSNDIDTLDVDSEEELDQITRKIMNEVSLEERCPVGSSLKKTQEGEDQDVPSSPELPWCVLCNNDAKYRCLDCSGDLYCSSCNIEVHKTFGETDHRVVSYKQKGE